MPNIFCYTCNGEGELEKPTGGPMPCSSCGGNGYIEVTDKALLIRSKKTCTHIECIKSGKCQETEGFKGTEHEGVDVCEDGCVWFDPRK